MADSDELYNLICGKRFDSIELKQDEILRVLKGGADQVGLCEQMRSIRKTVKLATGVVAFLLSVVTVQGIVWIFEVLKSAVR